MCPAWVASESRVNAGLLTRFHIEMNFRHWVKMETRRVRKEVSFVYCQDREVGDPMLWWTNSNCSCPKRWLKTSCGLELATRFTELIVDKKMYQNVDSDTVKHASGLGFESSILITVDMLPSACVTELLVVTSYQKFFSSSFRNLFLKLRKCLLYY